MVMYALVACEVLLALAMCYGLYFFFLALPLTPWRKLSPLENRPRHRFAVLVFAKDEERVIGNLLQSLKEQDYPSKLFDVFVTADNCTDTTAAEARATGAIVWERFDVKHIGKGYALRWFFKKFTAQYAGHYDACVVFDADNIVETGFLSAMNRELNRGADVAVGYRMGKNPTSSWVAGVTTLFWLLQTRFVNRARMRRQLPCLSVGGTGFMFSLDVLPDGEWDTLSTSEDIEFTLNAIADGRRIDLATDAVFYDEQPLKLSQSMTQRYRWTVGTFQSMVLCLPKIWRSKRISRLSKLDAVMFCVGVPVSAINVLLTITATVLTLVLTQNWMVVGLISLGATLVGYIATCWVAWLTLRLERVSWPGAWKSILGFPIFLVTWAALYVLVLFYRSTKWKPIAHVEALELESLVARRHAAIATESDDAEDSAARVAVNQMMPPATPYHHSRLMISE